MGSRESIELRGERLMRIAAVLLLITGGMGLASAKTYVVNQKHAQASDAGAGTEDAPYLTINKGAQMANAGDTVLVHAGIYREMVAPPRGGTATAYITYMAVPGETVYIRGSKVWSTGVWTPVAGSPGAYSAPLDQTLFGAYKPFTIAIAGSTQGGTLGQVFLNGFPCREIGNAFMLTLIETDPYLFSYDATNKSILLRLPPNKTPTDYLIEITTEQQVFSPSVRKLGYIRLKGFILEQCANQYPADFWSIAANKQAGLVGCKSGNHFIIENNTIRYAKSIGIDCGNEGSGGGGNSGMGSHVIQNNVIAYCGCGGIMGEYSAATRITGNLICGMDYHRQNETPEAAGIKFHMYNGGLIEHNLFINNNVRGVWLDAGPTNVRITRNVFINNGGSGVFIELARHQTGVRQVLIDNNFVAESKYQNYASDPEGDGMYMHDASGVTTAHNFCYSDTGFSFMMRTVTNRTNYGEIVETSNNKIYNNIFADATQGTMHAPYPGTGAVENDEDANLFTDGKVFIATTYGLTPIEQIQTAFATACPGDSFRMYTDRENRSNYTYPPNGKTGVAGGQQYGVILSLAQWQKLMKWGAHDAPNTLSGVSLSTTDGVKLSFTIGDAPWNTQCVAVTGVDKDFFGTAIPATGALPGPFQNLQKGANTVTLWDGPVPHLPDPEAVAVSPREPMSRSMGSATFSTRLVRLSVGRSIVDRRDWGTARAIEVFDVQGNLVAVIPTAARSSVDLRLEVRTQGRVLLVKFVER